MNASRRRVKRWTRINPHGRFSRWFGFSFHDVARKAGILSGLGAAGGAMVFGTMGAVLGAPGALIGGFVWARRKASARHDQIEAAFPAAVRAMADAVRAGGNIQSALAQAASESVSPMSDELCRVLDEIQVGVPIDQALAAFAQRCRVPGADVLSIALSAAIRSGADVRQVLDAIVESAADRRRLRGELRAATAQGRMTGLVIGSLPGAFLLVMGAGGGSELRFLFHEPAGWALLATGLLLEAAGFAWMRRLGRVS